MAEQPGISAEALAETQVYAGLVHVELAKYWDTCAGFHLERAEEIVARAVGELRAKRGSFTAASTVWAIARTRLLTWAEASFLVERWGLLTAADLAAFDVASAPRNTQQGGGGVSLTRLAELQRLVRGVLASDGAEWAETTCEGESAE